MAVLSSVLRAGDARVNGVLSGYGWAGGRVSYSSPDRASDYGGGYAVDFDGDGRSVLSDGFARLSSAQLSCFRGALDRVSSAQAGFSVEGFTNLAVTDAGAGSGAGSIRAAQCADVDTSYAFLPGSGMGGDVWLGGSGRAPRAGNYDNLTILHEVGHALGLKHSHESWGLGRLASGYDSLEYTVMTYRPWAGGAPTGYHFEGWGAPQSYMMLDIAAMQHMYGADFGANAGDTTYSWRPGSGRTYVDGRVGIDPGGNRIFATVWDGGGKDTYDLSDYDAGVRVDIRPGMSSTFTRGQLADLGGGPNGGDARGNIFNALQYKNDARSLIENVEGGSGGDFIYGNAAANRLAGNAGNDRICGSSGRDTLIGGKGADVFVFDYLSHSSRSACDRIVAGDGAGAFEKPGRSLGDRIDLHRLDADMLRAGHQDFDFGTSKGRGDLWLSEAGGVTYVNGNVDADAAIEFQVAIHDGSVRASAYSAHDFIL
jgi:serralysin